MIDMDTSNCYTRFGVVYVNVGENQASFARVFSFDSVYWFLRVHRFILFAVFCGISK